MINLSQEQLRKVQLTELELLKEVDRICKKCGIRYNIIAGTLLGAVRHKGFIPWDDDADVAFLRDEYEKFRKACEKELNHEKYYFQDHRNTKGYRWGYGKLRKKNTIFLRENQEHMPYEQGVFIDIFPLDNVPENKILRIINNFHCFLIRKIFWSEVGKITSSSKIKRVCFMTLNKMFGNRIYKHYDKLIKKLNRRPSKWVRTLAFPTANKQYGYLRRWYETSQSIVFEDFMFDTMESYDEYLTFKFGDYMQLPPDKERKIHPVSNIVI